MICWASVLRRECKGVPELLKKKKKAVDKRIASLYTNKVGCVEAPPTNGILAQLGEHLPYKQRVIGSSPIGSIPTKVGS